MAKPSKIEIQELFMATAGGDFSRCFHGTIKRSRDTEGNPRVFGKIKVNDTYIIATAKDQWVLGNMLDEMVLAVLNGHTKANKPVGGVNMN